MSSRGTQRENLVKDYLEADGFWVARAAGSLGDADLAVMCSASRSLAGKMLWTGKLLVEVKSTAAGPFCDFGPKDRAELLLAGEKAGADVVLCWCPPSPGKKIELKWYWPDSWPKLRVPLAA